MNRIESSQRRAASWFGGTLFVAALQLALALAPSPALVVAGAAQPPPSAEFFEFLSKGKNFSEFRDLVSFLEEQGVAEVVPIEHLVRQGTDWRKAGEPAYAMPPRELWPNIVPTLRLVRQEVLPLVGEVDVVSCYRTAEYNERAGGAGDSAHMNFTAVDLVPRGELSKSAMHRGLLDAWKRNGTGFPWGLGLYSSTRFHVDTTEYRRW